MEYLIKNKLVNWQDCMSVSAAHFIQSENYFIDSIRDCAYQRMNRFNFGLLPMNQRNDDSSMLALRERMTGSVEIQLNFCHAITASGIRIDYRPETDRYLTGVVGRPAGKEGKESKTFDVILAVDPYKREPVGEPILHEIPARHPDADKTYAMLVVPSGDVDAYLYDGHHLVIGRLRYRNDKFEIDPHYIPPCTSMRSHPDLFDCHNRLGQQFVGLGKDSSTIVAKTLGRPNDSRLAANIRQLCQAMLNCVATFYFNYRNTVQFEAPIATVNFFSTLAHVMYANINTLPGSEKEELLKYFYEWSDVTPGTFEAMLAQNMETMYDHGNIRTAMLQTESFMNTVSDLWKRLNQLDYIGQHKDSIVVSERVQEMEQTETLGWSVVD